MVRFPQYIDDGREDDVDNAAVQVFGRRFFKDQTPVEYLAEFFLVFASAKDEIQANAYAFPDYSGVVPLRLTYHPPYRLGLKLFAFLGASKLETRHRVHISSFRDGVSEVERRIRPDSSISPPRGCSTCSRLVLRLRRSCWRSDLDCTHVPSGIGELACRRSFMETCGNAGRCERGPNLG